MDIDIEPGKIGIAAPVCTAAEAQAVIAAGASEVYCGAMFDDWCQTYGNADNISRRQGRRAHVRTLQELTEITRVVNAAHCTAALTVNARYTRGQEKQILHLVQQWEDIGGHAVMVADIGIILALQERRSHLKCYLSLLAGVYNSASAKFFGELGVTRLVLPRELAVDDMSALVAAGPLQMQYEAIVLNQKCPFIDGMCHFYHEVHLPVGVPVDFEYGKPLDAAVPQVRQYDPGYEGHGCQLPWQTNTGQVSLPRPDDFFTPHCAACFLPNLYRAGVTCFKIAGRAYPLEIILDDIVFLRRVIDIWNTNGEELRKKQTIKKMYTTTFAGSCQGKCYYKIQGC